MVSRFSNTFSKSTPSGSLSTDDDSALTAELTIDDSEQSGNEDSNDSVSAKETVFDVTSTCQVIVKSNGKLQELDCILETATGKVNASLDVQLRTVEKLLAG